MEHVMDLRRRRRVGNLKEGVQSEDLSINGRIIFNWMINKQAGSVCVDRLHLEQQRTCGGLS
jgi:hypothetical protein